MVLVGGGHSHVHVLRMLAVEPPPDVRLTLISPDPFVTYSGMIPGTLAGLYAPEESRIDVAALAARARAAFLPDRVVAIDPEGRQVETAIRGRIAYDLLSLDVGSQPRQVARVRGLANVVPIKPIERAAQAIEEFAARAAGGEIAPTAVVVGAGAGGVEVAFALAARLARVAGARVTIVEQASELLPGSPERVRELVGRLVERYRIATLLGTGPVAADERGVVLRDGRRLDAALVVWATGAEGGEWLRESGLPLDARGFVRVEATLRSVKYGEIYAAGDCAVLDDHPEVPRAGVYAVRQGPVLERNLRAALRGGRTLETYRPQAGFLSLLSTGDRRAVLSYHGLAGHGRVWWRLKDWIDRRFVARYAPPRRGSLEPPPDLRPGRRRRAMGGNAMQMEPCGGCAAKVDAGVLARVLASLGADAPHEQAGAAQVVIGLEAPDDAALIRHDGGEPIVATIDGFPPFSRDLYTVGEIAAMNAVSDVYAMGGVPTAALALVALAADDPGSAEADLLQLLRGARAALERVGAPLAGGHTIASDAPLVGFTVLGRLIGKRALTKAGARPGDRLVLSKPLGTGVVLAAAGAGECPADWTEAALDSMRRSNGPAARAFVQAGLCAATDVSGFGLLGHLLEMLRASHMGARVSVERVPALPGARELLAAGWRSSAHALTRQFLRAAVLPAGAGEDDARLALLCDPQTSGGLLAAVPAHAFDGLDRGLREAGIELAVIGEVIAEGAGTVVLS